MVSNAQYFPFEFAVRARFASAPLPMVVRRLPDMVVVPDPVRRTPAEYVRRPDGSWNILPLVLGTLLLGIAAILLFGDGFVGSDPGKPSLTDTTPNTPVAK